MYYTFFSLIIPLQTLVFAICLVTAVAAKGMLLLPQSMLYSGNTADLACLRYTILLIALYVQMMKLFLVQVSAEMSDQSPVFSIKVGFSNLFHLQQKKLIMRSVVFPETGVARNLE